MSDETSQEPSKVEAEPATSQKDFARRRKWQSRVERADKAYKAWDERYHTTDLEDMYLGHQWDPDEARKLGFDPDGAMALYTMNLFFPAWEARRPSLLFDNPKILITPRATRTDDPTTTVDARCQLLADTANTQIQDSRKRFKEEVDLAVHESAFRFGVIEEGYENKTSKNPKAGEPILAKDGVTEATTDQGERLLQPDSVIDSETFYTRRIPADQFRVSWPSKNALEENDWVGYFEWVHPSDLKDHPKYKNTEYIKAGGAIVSGGRPESEGNLTASTDPRSDEAKQADRVKIWKIWDLRKKVRHVFPDDGQFFLLDSDPFEYLPIHVIKFHEILNQFYPLPPMFNWMSPQKEYNEVREMLRVHRKRMYRRYLVRKDGLEDGAMEKLETGGDGAWAEALSNRPLADIIAPIPDAPLDSTMLRTMPSTKEDFTQITGISGEQRSVTTSSTATQAKILEVNSRMRGDVMRNQVAKFLSDIVTTLIRNIINYATVPLLIRTHVDPTSMSAPLEAQQIEATWQRIEAQHLTGVSFEWEARVDIESISPPSEAEDRETWDRLLQLLANPTLCQILFRSPNLLKMTLRRYGITSQSVIEEVKATMIPILVQAGMIPPPPGMEWMAPGAGMPPGAPGPRGLTPGPNPPGISGGTPPVRGSSPGVPSGSAPRSGPAGPGTPARGSHDVGAQLRGQMR